MITEVKKRSFKKIELSFKKHSVSRKLGGGQGARVQRSETIEKIQGEDVVYGIGRRRT